MTNAPSSESLLRWTYAGALDDMVVWHPWPKIKVGRQSLHERLAYSVVAGTPFLLNDGYLVLNEACVKSLEDEHSPLRVLLNAGYVRVLSRTPSRHFEQLIRDGAKQKIPSYENLLKDKRKLQALIKTVKPIEDSLRTRGYFVDWPKQDLTPTYMALISHLLALPHAARGMPGVPEREFEAVATQFLHQVSSAPNAPRSQWKTIAEAATCKKKGPLNLLMQLANEVYHLNFGIGLAAAAPDNMPVCREIAVQTRMPVALSEFYKTHEPKVQSSEPWPQPPALPRGVDYSNGHLLTEFFDSRQDIGAARQDYLVAHASFLDRTLSSSEMCRIAKEYQQQINQYLLRNAPRGKRTGKLTNAGVTAGAIAVGVGLASVGIVGVGPAIAIGVVAYFATDFAVPTLLERWKPAGKLDDAINKKWLKAVDERRVLASLAVDSDRASKLIASATGNKTDADR
jgi:hypothetical protein